MNDIIDLGNDPDMDFDLFADEDELSGAITKENDTTATSKEEANKEETNKKEGNKEETNKEEASTEEANERTNIESRADQKSTLTSSPSKEEVAKDESNLVEADIPNPIEAAFESAETETAKKTTKSLAEKPPIFEFGGAKEEINDSSQTFEELRIEKATDFPELEDGKRVKWAVVYGKISKDVSDAKTTSIGKMKTEIEDSKEFIDSLKKSKDKNPTCILKPRVTAQSKGGKA